MAQSSPSEFLTFYRRALRASHRVASRSIQTTRPFSQSIIASRPASNPDKKHDVGSEDKNKKHVLDKGHDPNVQTEQSQKGKEHRATDSGGVATQQKSGGAHEKAKKEFPEAPTTIGFQDERGGKGH
ncbi:hypothetical protein HII31_13685 [Pseudocercospora fuligena]|uniref:Uncharacterized protein n=1 Tax=Pseudocercospora fuligena TaxID=685502 RepID=A0A8H6R770_9PEZI|nr:hypothetical protein HII31_13685 [Pseudocercospora fuligena]